MNRVVSIFAIAATLISVRPARAEQAELKAEDAIRITIESYAAAWNNSDAAAVARLYTADADYTGFGSVMTRGRVELERVYAQLFSGAYSGTRLATTVSSIRFLKPDVAIVDGALELSGLRAADGAESPAPGLYVAILTKDRATEQWLLTTLWSKRLAALPTGSAPK